MDIYFKLFEVIFPVFFVVGIGYYLGKKDPKINTKFITNFAANVGSPAIVFYSVVGSGLTFDSFKIYFFYYFLLFIFFFIFVFIFFFFLIFIFFIYNYIFMFLFQFFFIFI